MVIRKRLDICGPALFFVTTTVTDRKPAFNDPVIAQAVLLQLDESLKIYQVSLTGYVLMPTHFHALLGFRQAEDLSRFMQSFKILTSKRVKDLPESAKFGLRGVHGSFALWKPRFDDLLINSEKQFRVKLNYIHENRVRAGLVGSAAEWPYSSAATWYQDRAGLLAIDKDFKWTR